MVAVANATISDPDVSISVPLFSIEHKITHGSPDEYVTNYTSSHSATPLFRIGASTVFTLHVNEMISGDQSLTGLSGIIKAVQMATTIAAPQASVLTTLSSPSVQDASHAIESTVSGILSSHKTEDIELARDMSLFFDSSNSKTGDGGHDREAMFDYSIVARAPSNFIKYSFERFARSGGGDTGDYDNKAKPVPIVGHWFVWLTCPRPSIFSPQDICDDVAPSSADPADGAKPSAASAGQPGPSQQRATTGTGISAISSTPLDTNAGYPGPLNQRIQDTKTAIVQRLQGRLGEVLNTRLSSQVTVEDFVTSSSAYKSFFSKTSKAPADTTKFCADVIDALYKQGLSNFDARIVIWAMARNLSDVLQLPTTTVTTKGATPRDYVGGGARRGRADKLQRAGKSNVKRCERRHFRERRQYSFADRSRRLPLGEAWSILNPVFAGGSRHRAASRKPAPVVTVDRGRGCGKDYRSIAPSGASFQSRVSRRPAGALAGQDGSEN